MKKLILSLCLLLMSLTAFGNEYYKNLPNGEFEVVEKSGNSKEQMWKLVEEWLSINFKPTEYTVQKNEADGRYTINWTIKGEPFSKYTDCDASAVYIIDINEEGYRVMVRKPQCTLKPKGFPHQYVMPFRNSVVKAVKQFIEENSEKYYRKTLTWDDDANLAKLQNELYEESIRLPRNQDGTPKPTKRYFIMVEKHNICETVRGSVLKANVMLLESLYKTMTSKQSAF